MTVAVGSYFVVRTSGLAGRLIRIGTCSPVNHAGIVVSATGDTMEGQPGGAGYGHLSHYDGHLLIVNDLEWLTDAQRAAIVDQARGLTGTPYSWLDIVALGLACFGLRSGWIAKRVARNDRLICSQLVDLVYQRAGIHMFDDGRLPSAVTPGDLLLRIAQHRWKAHT